MSHGIKLEYMYSIPAGAAARNLPPVAVLLPVRYLPLAIFGDVFRGCAPIRNALLQNTSKLFSFFSR